MVHFFFTQKKVVMPKQNRTKQRLRRVVAPIKAFGRMITPVPKKRSPIVRKRPTRHWTGGKMMALR